MLDVFIWYLKDEDTDYGVYLAMKALKIRLSIIIISIINLSLLLPIVKVNVKDITPILRC